jgi:hypothetical protein
MTRHLALAVFLAVSFPAAMTVMATPYTGKGPPGTYVKAPRPKDQSRLPQATPLVRSVPVEAIKPRVAALAELVASPLPCGTVRQAVETYGKEAVRAAAKARGYTKKQIDEAMACLTEKKT